MAGQIVLVLKNGKLVPGDKGCLQRFLLLDSERGCVSKKMRLDQLLVQQGLFPSRERAQAAIMAGVVLVGGQRCDKAGTPVVAEATIEIKGKPHPYVSRGGLKLAQALDMLGWSVEGWQAVDLGASTGGFTDCLLQRGAARVCAVDVGRGQLDMKLQKDPRVIIFDKTNARYVEREQLPFAPDLVTADLAFISLRLLFPVIYRWQVERLTTLIKPQFETEAKFLRKGVVLDPAVHQAVLIRVTEAAACEGWVCCNLTHSPLRGPAGNIEFVAGFTRSATKPVECARFDWAQIVAVAHQSAV
ncbi:TlyA family RNA methyltransferase [bacterium]|nr:TlyA family RNA methyltransferase [bacterium]